MSYAEEDGEAALEIAKWLEGHGLAAYRWQDPRNRGGRFIEQIEGAINQADAFLALLSPNFLASPWCRLERDLAMHREQDLRAGGSTVAFIHVLKIANGSYQEAGFLRGYDWTDLTDSRTRQSALMDLAQSLRQARSRETAQPAAAGTSPWPLFRNRQDELDKVIRGLTNAAGPHFWLVIAPPQLGKTWFLRRVSTDGRLAGAPGWVTRLADLRGQPAAVRRDPAALLALLFGRTAPVAIGQDTFRGIAREISRNGKPHLCLLDSAELLDAETAATLRSCLSQIYRLVQDAGQAGVRLALLVASRREDDWRGVYPDPRLSPLPLTEFKADVVQQALRDLALEMDRTFTGTEFRRNAALAHKLTEGLPALLVRCLQWIRSEEWLGMERLQTQELFEEIADPYIREELFSPGSLLPRGDEESAAPTDESRRALEEAFRVLAPYRLFTQSHLRQYFGPDRPFEETLRILLWSMEDLWRAISGTALLLRPLNEPWQQIHAAIRRILYRYYYTSDERRADAHRDARKFVEVWADNQAGKEQVIGLVECLWHEAAGFRLGGSAEMADALCKSARTLSRALRPSPAYTITELREFAAEQMRNDEEFQETVSTVDGLLNTLAAIVVAPPQES